MLSSIQTALNHHRHFVPGLVHFSTVYAFDYKAVEYDVLPVDRRLRQIVTIIRLRISIEACNKALLSI